MSDLAIEIKNLNKTYQNGKVAVKDLNLSIPKGSFMALLGPNGAGKSTTINIIASLVNKTSGTVKINGYDIDTDTKKAKMSIGIVTQEIYFDPFFTLREVLEIQAGLYDIPKSQRKTDELLEAMDLTEKANVSTRALSGGMKRRLLVAKAMVHNPKILILDEPTAGVDIQLRHNLWVYVKKLNAQGVTVILTTHYLEEAEDLCETTAIINNGAMITVDSTKNLVNKIDKKILSVTTEQNFPDIKDQFPNCIVTIKDNIAEFTYSSTKVKIRDILSIIASNKLDIQDLSTQEGDLEDIFLELTNTSL